MILRRTHQKFHGETVIFFLGQFLIFQYVGSHIPAYLQVIHTYIGIHRFRIHQQTVISDHRDIGSMRQFLCRYQFCRVNGCNNQAGNTLLHQFLYLPGLFPGTASGIEHLCFITPFPENAFHSSSFIYPALDSLIRQTNTDHLAGSNGFRRVSKNRCSGRGSRGLCLRRCSRTAAKQ